MHTQPSSYSVLAKSLNFEYHDEAVRYTRRDLFCHRLDGQTDSCKVFVIAHFCVYSFAFERACKSSFDFFIKILVIFGMATLFVYFFL